MKYDALAQLKQIDAHIPSPASIATAPKTMELRVTRPGFINGIKALKAKQGIAGLRPNRDATRQEMRSFVCAQCHVEYYCGPKETLLFPWANGTKVEEIEAFYDSTSSPTAAILRLGACRDRGPVFKAQHPEFEVWSQGIHARSGVACADCHMPYMREGAMKVSEHWIRSPLLMVNRSCQPCHPYPESEIGAGRDDPGPALRSDDRAGEALVDMLDAVKAAKSGRRAPSSCSRSKICSARRSGGWISSPPRTPWASTPRRNWPECWPNPSIFPAKLRSRP